METNTSKLINLHFNSLPKETKKALDFLSEQEWISESGWYLAGGTALALQVGNRLSIDLDFFTTENSFENEDLNKRFSGNKDWIEDINKKNTVYGKLLGCKISFIAYPFFIPKQEFMEYGFVNILKPKDIAVMKVIAISQRGKKRDFFDLFWIVKNLEPLIDIIKRLKGQYPSVAHDYHHILKSLVYFDDAESDPEPVINFEANWKEVKDFFSKEIIQITKELVIS
ncbi:MAG: nucleotidyl transferase AbiEii/AbiGii toxin family protein [bacterium]|nr:nucleotidyl transferase AbiEii/AbiGii toxin family protein [bacterium]